MTNMSYFFLIKKKRKFGRIIQKMITTNQDYACVIENKLYYGNSKPAKDESILTKLGVKSIVDLINYKSKDKEIKHSPSFNVFHSEIEDLPTNNIDWCEEPSKFIDEQLSLNNIVYVHCAQGISRSSALVIYYLMTRYKQELKQTFDQIRKIRNVACPSYGFMKGLSALEQKLYNKSTFPPVEYSLLCISELFPKLSKEEITEIYKNAESEFSQNKEAYNELAISKNIEPIGFNTLDKIIEKYGKNDMLKRTGCSLHHPFD